MQHSTRGRAAPGLLISMCVVLFSLISAPAWAAPAAQTVPPPPDNDYFANATELAVQVYAEVDLSAATLEAGEPQPVCGVAGATRWFTFTVTEVSRIHLGFDRWSNGEKTLIVVALYAQTGDGFGGLTAIACSDTGTIVTEVTPGQAYFVQVATIPEPWWQVPYTYLLLEQQSPPPPPITNDALANATELVLPVYAQYVDLSATTLEMGEPQPACGSVTATAWLKFTAQADGKLKLYYGAPGPLVFALFSQAGDGFGGLMGVDCSATDELVTEVTAGQEYVIQVGAAEPWDTPSAYIFLELLPLPPSPPTNDSFADAEVHDGPFSSTLQLQGATLEEGEPLPCGYSEHTAWYKLTSEANHQFWSEPGGNTSFVALYSGAGSRPADLQFEGCLDSWYYSPFRVPAGETRYIQIGGSWYDEPTRVHVIYAGTPEAYIGMQPYEPSRYDNVQFSVIGVFAPGAPNEEFDTATWNFGDGSPTASGVNVSHKYARDGQYTVSVTASTWDGRTAANQQLVTVATHNVSIARMTVPKSGTVGKQSLINVEIVGTDGAENVTVTLFRRDANRGDVSVGSSSQWVSDIKKKGTTFSFTYSFGPEDAQNSPIRFLAVATIDGGLRDGIEADNAALSAPVVVKPGKYVVEPTDEMQEDFTFTTPPTLLYLPVIEER